MNGERRSSAMPYVIGVAVVAMLGSLGLWQVSRGFDKRAGLDAYTSEEAFERYYEGMSVRPFQRLRFDGRYNADRQVIIDNMIVGGRNGHFVITPLVRGDAEPVLLVNRGWIEKAGREDIEARVAFDADRLTVLGRVGHLPRAGMRMGDAFAGSAAWPRQAVYPTSDEVADALGVDVLPFVLLLDPDEPHGFVRQWEPEELSASRHFGYAFQWFAMAAMLSALLVFYYRRNRHRKNRKQ